MKTGVGVGSFKNWKKVYLVEQQDYNIAVYKTDKVGALQKWISLFCLGNRVQCHLRRNLCG